ncbi:hypothetical protein [Sulfurovum sp. TSL1]|uniref:hypothetical protein n=1 Tax=Sulfurovum sp. TSL1 TaxID=2826994 RepID=UPI001CC78EF1|nr:hypothetical protein [Sulfurovum sp. TSL1]GIT98524.1 hypothetical protein TSL1_13450 [Sulfurovum sp. TSL1]
MSSIILKSSDSHPMKEIFEQYFLVLDFSNENYIIELSTFNSNFFSDGYTLINNYALVLNDFKDYANSKQKRVRFIEFIKYSIKHSQISDRIEYFNFKVKDDHILFKQDGEKQDWINMGEFYIDNYKINVCSSYLFFTDLLSEEQFMYYAD